MLVLPVVALVIAYVQGDNGTIAGTTTDQYGPVAEASIAARHVMSGDVTRTKSDAAGRYSLSVRQGHYSLWVEAAGHESLWLARVLVGRGETTTQHIFLKKTTPP